MLIIVLKWIIELEQADGLHGAIRHPWRPPVCDSKTTLEGLDHQHLWWLEKAATCTTLDLEILQGITPVEDIRELLGTKP